MKRIIFAGVLICLIGIVIVMASNTRQSVSNTTELSPRAEEYLAKQKAKGNLDFGGVAADKNDQQAAGAQTITVGDCFSILIPFQITDTKHMGDCFDQLTITSPRGIINVYTREVSFAALDDDPGVKMRRADPDTYKEERKSVKGHDFILFEKSDGGYEKTALYVEGSRLFSLNLLVNGSGSELDEKFNQMLESVEFR